MSEQRVAATDRLADVIDAIRLGRRTGTLNVVRNTGISHDEGQIIFMSGRPVWANAGNLSGQEALQWLATWGTCRFGFNSSLPANFAPSTNGSGSLEGTRKETGSHTRVPSAQTGPNTGPISSWNQEAGQPAELPPSFLMSAPHRLHSVNDALSVITRQGLSRSYRHLFMLIDGQRKVQDLMQLTGRSLEDLYEMLERLEQAGLIQL